MTSPIEKAAFEFIDARRKKLDEKAARNALLSACKFLNEATCSFVDDNEETWCEKCKAAKVHSEAYHRHRDEMNNAVKRLKRAVNRHDKAVAKARQLSLGEGS